MFLRRCSGQSGSSVSAPSRDQGPFRQGVTLQIGVTGGGLCAAAAILHYMVARGSAAGPLFCWGDGRYLTEDRFVKTVRVAFTRAGYKAATVQVSKKLNMSSVNTSLHMRDVRGT